MKKIFILSILAVGLAGCASYSHAPDDGMLGNYGFTYDLHTMPEPPAPFVNNTYRPLTPFDLAAPTILVVTNQPPPRIVYQQEPLIGEPVYSGVSPRPVVAAPGSTVIESSGAQAHPGVTPPATPSVSPNYNYGSGGYPVVFPANGTNNGGEITNETTPQLNRTATNGSVNQTNPVIGEPSGTQLRTNRPSGQPSVPPQTPTNRILLAPPVQSQPVQQTPAPVAAPSSQPIQAPAQAPAVRTAPVQRPASPPPASAPKSSPTPTP